MARAEEKKKNKGNDTNVSRQIVELCLCHCVPSLVLGGSSLLKSHKDTLAPSLPTSLVGSWLSFLSLGLHVVELPSNKEKSLERSGF